MASPHATAAAPFGRVLTAMVTPFRPDGDLDLPAVAELARHLVDAGNDGLVVSGTTGESSTTDPEEDGRVLETVLQAVGGRASVVAGVGNNDTRASARLARQAAALGADGLLCVTPYYSRPPQAGLLRHFAAVTEAGDGVPVMLYDVPGRTGVRIDHATYVEAARDSRVVAVKDAAGDLALGAAVMRDTGLSYYSGDDALTLAWLAFGAVGTVSVVGHVAAGRYAAMVRAVDEGRVGDARDLNTALLPVVEAIMGPETRGAITAKAALQAQGVMEHRTVRAPLVDASDDQVQALKGVLADADLL